MLVFVFQAMMAAAVPPLTAQTPSTRVEITLGGAQGGLEGSAVLENIACNPCRIWLHSGTTLSLRRESARNADLSETVPSPQKDVSIHIVRGRASAALRRLELSFSSPANATQNHCLCGNAFFSDAATSHWLPAIDGRRSIVDATFDTPSDFSVVASGMRVRDVVRNGRRRAEFRTSWPSHPAFVAAPFVRRAAIRSAVPLWASLLKPRPEAEGALTELAHAMSTQVAAFGPFPFSDYGIVEVPAHAGAKAGLVAGSYEGFLVIRSDWLDAKGFAFGVLAHELGHQWWGNLVARTGSKGDYLADEALAQYAAYLSIERKDGAAAGRDVREGSDDLALGGARQAAATLGAYGPRALNRLTQSPASYALGQTLGGLTWDAAARIAGRERFHQGLRRAAAQYAFKEVTWDRLLDAVLTEVDPGLRSRVRPLFAADRMPVLSATFLQDGGHVQISIQNDGATPPFPVPVWVQFADGTALVTSLSLTQPRTQSVLTATSPVLRVELDPAHTMAWVGPEVMDEAVARGPYLRAMDLWNAGNTPAAKRSFEAILAAPPVPDRHGVEFLTSLAYAEVLEEEGKLSDANEDGSKLKTNPPSGKNVLACVSPLGWPIRCRGDTQCASDAVRSTYPPDAQAAR